MPETTGRIPPEAQNFKAPKETAEKKAGFFERHASELRAVFAAISVAVATEEAKAVDTAPPDFQHTQQMNRHDGAFKELENTIGKHKKQEGQQIEDYKNEAVDRLNKSFPRVPKEALEKIFDNELSKMPNADLKEKRALVNDLYVMAREQFSPKEKTNAAKPETKTESHNLNKRYEDGVSLNVDYDIKKTDKGHQIFYEGAVSGFNINNYFEKGHNMSDISHNAPNREALITMAEEDARNLYVTGKILESLPSDSKDYQNILGQFKILFKQFQKTGVKLDLEKFPGVKMVK